MAVKYLKGSEKAYAAYQPHTQVYYATHTVPDSLNKSEWLRKKYMDRSFISFSYGGKWIEDFNLIAVTTNDRLQRNLHADYEDSVSSYDVLDGQFYWGTHFTNNSLALTLATDGITQVQLEDFRRWFVPGTARELILAEHPNRAIMARLETSPALSVLPFEEKTTLKIDGREYETSTTLYKGEITINFIMDEPYWYALSNVLGGVEGRWVGAGGTKVRIFDDPDALKIIAEDGVPTGDMFRINTLIGEDYYIDTDFSLVAPKSQASTGHGTSGTATNTKYAEADDGIVPIYGFIGPRESNSVPLTVPSGSNSGIYLYYPGTAPSRSKLSFTLTPALSGIWVSTPKNSYVTPTSPYNTITLTCSGSDPQKFLFTTPSIYTAYNQVVQIFNKDSSSSTAWVAVGDLIKENVNHYYVRKWASAVVTYLINNTTGINSTTIATAVELMSYFLKDNSGNMLSASFSFDSKNGEALGQIGCRQVGSSIPTQGNWTNTWGKVITIKENVGDMVRSDYLILKERNLPNANGNITANEAYKLTHDVTGGLSDVTITYQYMYY